MTHSAEYAAAIGTVEAAGIAKGHFSVVMQQALWPVLYDRLGTDEARAAVVEDLLAQLLNEPRRISARAELFGMAFLAPEVRFSPDDLVLLLRPVRKEDLEWEMEAHAAPKLAAEKPTAIVEFSFLSKHPPPEACDLVLRVLALLRLFRAMSGQSLCYWFDPVQPNSIGRIVPDATAVPTYLSFGTIEPQDSRRLQAFWREMYPRIPEGFYARRKISTDALSIAYQRYSDALVRESLRERRIASAVMGMEALLLGNEGQELSYKLSVRTGKLLALLGRDGMRVRDLVKLAYAVRSQFVHGGHLSGRERGGLHRRSA